MRKEELAEAISDKIEYFITKDNGDIDVLKSIIVIIAAGVLVGSIFAMPYILKHLPSRHHTPKNKQRIHKALIYLKKHSLVDIRKDKVSLTEKGVKKLNSIQYEILTIPRPKKWDKQWRIVIFDIPERYRSTRDLLRTKLKKLGFYQIQKSTWIYPFSCKTELESIRSYHKITPYVSFIEAHYIEDEEVLRKYFHL